MGCDIHAYLETFNPVQNKWEACGEWIADEATGELDIARKDEALNGRNYALFAILAGVRDYSGSIVKIAEPRGFPDTASVEVQNEFNQWGADAHTPSYLTLDELQDFDWSLTLEREALISGEEYFSWKHFDKPRGTEPNCIWRHTKEEITIEKLTELREAKENLAKYYVVDTFEVPYYKLADRLFSETIPRMLIQCNTKQLSATDVRLVFWFDN